MGAIFARGLTACLVVLALTGVPQARAGDDGDKPPSPQKLGRFLGFVINCGCVKGDPDSIAAIFHALFKETYGESFADGMDGAMQLAMGEMYDNQVTLCARVCSADGVGKLQEIVAGVTKVTQSAEFQKFYGSDQPGLGQAADAPATTNFDEPDRWRCRMDPAAPNCRNGLQATP
jgi:hypothetical protein